MPAPIVAIVPPKPRRVPGITWSAAERNVRPILEIDPGRARAPEIPRQGDTPARPARMPIVVFTAFTDWLGVQKDDFGVRLTAPTPHAATPGSRPAGAHTGQLSWDERRNLSRGSPAAWGDLVTELRPQDVDGYVFA